jgi:hypothetical protein
MGAAFERRVLGTDIVAYDPMYREDVLALAREMHAESKSHANMPLNEANGRAHRDDHEAL